MLSLSYINYEGFFCNKNTEVKNLNNIFEFIHKNQEFSPWLHARNAAHVHSFKKRKKKKKESKIHLVREYVGSVWLFFKGILSFKNIVLKLENIAAVMMKFIVHFEVKCLKIWLASSICHCNSSNKTGLLINGKLAIVLSKQRKITGRSFIALQELHYGLYLAM